MLIVSFVLKREKNSLASVTPPKKSRSCDEPSQVEKVATLLLMPSNLWSSGRMKPFLSEQVFKFR